jgi:hypothetical protein
LRASKIPKEIASLRFYQVQNGYRFEVTGRPKGHVHFRSRGVPLCVAEDERSLFEGAIICWIPNDLSDSGPWWIDNGEMWSGHSTASDPLGIDASVHKIRELRPDWFGLRSFGLRLTGKISSQDRERWFRYFNWNTQRGDSRAAVVLQTDPLLVAAYSDDLHAAVVLKFPSWLVARHHLAIGSRLVTINNYVPGKSRAADLPPVDGLQTTLTNYRPLIAEFISDETDVIERRRKSIQNAEYELAQKLGDAYLRHNSYMCRRGEPFLSGIDKPSASARP